MALGVLFTLVLDNAKNAFNAAALDRRGHRPHLSAALVLVAHQRVERGERDGRRRSSCRWRSSLRAKLGHDVDATTALLITIAVTTIVWIAVTFCTPPVEASVLSEFYARFGRAVPAGRACAARTRCRRRPIRCRSRCSAGCSAWRRSTARSLRQAASSTDRPAEGLVWGARRGRAPSAGSLAVGRAAYGRPRQARRVPKAKLHRLQ